jgi:translocation and assembly module TamA
MMRFLASLLLLKLLLQIPIGYATQLSLFNEYRLFIDLEEQRILPGLPGQITTPEAIISSSLLNLVDSGYFAATIDSVVEMSDKTSIYLSKGPRYRINTIVLLSPGDTTIVEINTFYDVNSINRLINDRLNFLENNGYPLAEASLKTLDISHSANSLSVYYDVNPGELIEIAGLQFQGNNQLTAKYLAKESYFVVGRNFSSEFHQRYRMNLLNSPFIIEVSEPQLVKRNNQWYILFEIEESRSSYVDVVIGYNPTPGNTYSIIGTGDLQLNNLLAEGSNAYFRFDRHPFSESRLNLGYTQHWIGGLPIGVSGNAAFFQQDTTYLLRDFAISTQLSTQNGYKIGLRYNGNFTDRDDRIQQSSVVDASSRAFGVFVAYSRVNRRISPTNGVQYHIETSRGYKLINRVPEGSSLNRRYPFTTSSAWLRTFYPLTSRYVLANRVTGGFRFADVHFDDDLFRFGGATTLRGYREEQFRSTAYAWTDAELRFLLDSSSYLFIFGATGIYETPEQIGLPQSDTLSDVLYAGGFGLSYRVRLGILRFSYAISPDDSITNGKVHFGITNSF